MRYFSPFLLAQFPLAPLQEFLPFGWLAEHRLFEKILEGQLVEDVLKIGSHVAPRRYLAWKKGTGFGIEGIDVLSAGDAHVRLLPFAAGDRRRFLCLVVKRM